MAKRWFVTICHDFALHGHDQLACASSKPKNVCVFSSISDKIRWIYDRFRQMSPKSSVNVDVAVFWLHCYFWSICRHRFSGHVSLVPSHFFPFPNSQLIPTCAKHCVFTGRCACLSRPIFSHFLIHNLFQHAQNIVFSQVDVHASLVHVFLFPNSRLIRLTWPCQWIMSFVTCCFFLR